NSQSLLPQFSGLRVEFKGSEAIGDRFCDIRGQRPLTVFGEYSFAAAFPSTLPFHIYRQVHCVQESPASATFYLCSIAVEPLFPQFFRALRGGARQGETLRLELAFKFLPFCTNRRALYHTAGCSSSVAGCGWSSE